MISINKTIDKKKYFNKRMIYLEFHCSNKYSATDEGEKETCWNRCHIQRNLFA